MEQVLEIETNLGRSFITLTKERYLLGRSLRNCIVIKDPQVSRYHATLIKNPNGKYTIYDGDLKNKKSRNGLIVNQKVCSDWILENNDVIKLGDNARLKYYHASVETLNLLKLSYRDNSSDFIFVDEEIETTPSSLKKQQIVDNTPSFIKKTIVNLDSSSFEEELKKITEKYNIK